MFKIKYFLIFIIFLIIHSINAFEIGITWKDEAYIEEVYATYNIVGKDAYVNIVADIIVSPQYYKEHPSLYIHFDPWERSTHSPIENFNKVICNGKSDGSSYIYLNFICFENGKEINISDISSYYYKLNLTESDEYEKYMIYLNYTIPNFVRTQGDLNVVRLTFENMHNDRVKNDNIETYLVLSKEYSYPSVDPPDKETVDRDVLTDGRWVVIVKGYQERYITFIDETAQKKKLEQERKKGAILGGFISIMVGLIILLIQKRYGNNTKIITISLIFFLLILIFFLYSEFINWIGILVTVLIVFIGLLVYMTYLLKVGIT